ncbi:unnamed protein product [Linum tenue]|uniref:Endonuclease V n=1 Tax=Linum tenue TaxID=586396 RepID=A0AAV0RWE8_9ROSI|nr:unnamed protein product [Linum tenue]
MNSGSGAVLRYGDGIAEESAATSSDPEMASWIKIQDSLKKRLITGDDFDWTPPRSNPPSTAAEHTSEPPEEEVEGSGAEQLRYVGGFDVSYSKEDPSMACGILVVLDLRNLQVVYEDFCIVDLRVPYVPGFLAFREAPIILQLLEKMKKSDIRLYPQLLMVDGNGLLHPRGNWCVTTNVLALDSLHHVDGLTLSGVRQLLQAEENNDRDYITLSGYSGCTWGVAMRSSAGAMKPIFISVGHRISLETAVKIVKLTCKYRMPEPIRQADIRSRAHLRKQD